MAKNKKASDADSSLVLTRISRTLLFFVSFFALSTVIFDSGNLITRELVIERWVLTSILLAAIIASWSVAALTRYGTAHKIFIAITAAELLLFAGFVTYWERGMASTSTILYVLPILVIATLRNRHILLGTTALAAGVYALSAVLYFNTYFNEGYRIQLWGTLFQQVSTLFVTAWLIMTLTGLRRDSK